MTQSDTSADGTPLIAHLVELRRRVMVAVAAWLLAFIGCYLLIEPIYGFLVEPLAQSFAGAEQRRLIYTSLTETFFTYIKLALYAGLIVAFSVVATQAYLFLAPGLYKNEKGVLLPYLIAGPLLFFAGAAMAYYGVMPVAWEFFISFEAPRGGAGLPIELEAKVSEYLSLVIQIIFAFGLSFQLPIILTLMVRTGMLKTQTLRTGRKYAVVILLIAAATLTPPDIISQIGLFLPLYLLYEMSILACGAIEKKRAAASS